MRTGNYYSPQAVEHNRQVRQALYFSVLAVINQHIELMDALESPRDCTMFNYGQNTRLKHQTLLITQRHFRRNGHRATLLRNRGNELVLFVFPKIV